MPHKAKLEVFLKEKLGDLFELEYDLLLYDVTSTYFAGEAKANPLAMWGYSRNKRGDCKQVTIGLVTRNAKHRVLLMTAGSTAMRIGRRTRSAAPHRFGPHRHATIQARFRPTQPFDTISNNTAPEPRLSSTGFYADQSTPGIGA